MIVAAVVAATATVAVLAVIGAARARSRRRRRDEVARFHVARAITYRWATQPESTPPPVRDIPAALGSHPADSDGISAS